jgi:hypothetical protein
VSEIGLFSNLRLLAIVTASFALQIAIHHSASLRHVFGIAPVSLLECATWIALGCVPLLVLEARKWLQRTRAAGLGPTATGGGGGRRRGGRGDRRTRGRPWSARGRS